MWQVMKRLSLTCSVHRRGITSAPMQITSSLTAPRHILAGSAGSIKIGRKSKGLWRYSTGIGWFSPGLELNDIGYMQMTDIIRQTNANILFCEQTGIRFPYLFNWL